MFVSSHLMTEMALTADHLVVIGRGRLIADAPIDELTGRTAGKVVVRSPDAGAARRAAPRDEARPSRPRRRRRAHRARCRRADDRPAQRGEPASCCTSSPRSGRRSRTRTSSSPARASSTGANPAPARPRRGHPRHGRSGIPHDHRSLPRVSATTTDTPDPARARRPPRSSHPTLPPGGASSAPCIASEATKLRSVRSTVWTLFATLVATIGIGSMIARARASAAGTGPRPDQLRPDELQPARRLPRPARARRPRRARDQLRVLDRA